MVRDAELAARDYVALVCTGLPAETDINLVTGDAARRRAGALTSYADPAWAPTGWAQLADAARDGAGRRRAGQRLPARLGPVVRRRGRAADAELAVLRGWLDGDGVPAGLIIDTELRWSLLQALVADGRGRPRPRSRRSWPATGPPAASGRPRSARALIADGGEQGRDVARS